MMDLYIDTAEVTEWEVLMPTGLFTGITTNPLLAHRAGLDYPQIDWADLARRAADLGAKELFGQVYGPPETYVDFAGALFEAGRAAGISTVVKVPLTEAGIRAVPAVRKLGGPVLMTAAYNAKQMFAATALGAAYIAPYFGRMLEMGHDAHEVLGQMLAIGKAAGSGTRILVASIRDTDQLVRLGAAGQSCFTLAPSVAHALLFDANTRAAAADFEAAARSVADPG
ncbi:MAG TPA: transaldolase [Rhodobacteraceae bacterium]|nr:transaldolase [Paracoccaceae bacterium]